MDGSDDDCFSEGPTQPTQPTQAATQRPPQNAARSLPGVFASLVPRHPHLQPLTLETSRLLAGGYTIGRLDGCDVTLDRNYVSGRHCRLYADADPGSGRQCLYIADTSTNGTFVNDRIIGRGNCTILFNGDRIGFLRAADALPSDIALEYSVELADAQGPTKEQAEFGAELLRKYDFKREIGAGNFAKVWLAVHKQTGVACACKVINKKKHLFSAGLTKVFEREICIMRQLNHEHIVPLHELHIDKDRIHIFMEYLEGGDLFTHLSEHGPFSEAACRPLFKQICSAVRYLHANGITHRDIKLDNILIKAVSGGSVSVVKIADFGLARAVGDGETMRTICGTPSYLAPEIVCRSSSAVPYSKGVDMWALGVVLYALHMNSFPFSKLLDHGGTTGASLEIYSKACRMIATNEKYAGLSSELRDLLAGMLQIDPVRRLAIEAAIHHPWTQAGADGVPGPLHEPVEIWGALRVSISAPARPRPAYAAQPIHIDLFRQRTTIGRGRKSHVQITDPRVSSQHCEVVFRDPCVHVRSMGRSPLWVGGRPLDGGQTRALEPPFEFSLCTSSGGPGAAAGAQPPQPTYRFCIELSNLAPDRQPQAWVVLRVLGASFPRLHIFDRKATFGRAPGCTFAIDDAHISQTHCAVELQDGRACVSNGTFVNSRRVEGTVVLGVGDELVLLYGHIPPLSDGLLEPRPERATDRSGYPVLVGYRVVELAQTAPF
ncbi:hypothetical protein H4R18_000295 [Coemansia javaensis]|uniref:Uncharacterized protein n=1 Tax=Coemansia javaensis TaxID=2761396 RepID=A0A9W8LNC4_9FUNG|nr:hypothetical protein H4R18_000295 [Coemansia javaensis]